MKPVGGEGLAQLYEDLSIPKEHADGEAIFATQIDRGGHYRIGRDVHGHPVLLIKTPAPHSSSEILRSLQLKRLTVQHDVQCWVRHASGDAPSELSLSLIRCTDETLTEHFLRIVASLVNSLGRDPTRKQVSRAISRLAELFQALSHPQKGSAQGLWAELFVITRSSDPRLMVTSWHVDPEDRFDFSYESERLEVKSFAGSSRRHHFTLEQVRPSEQVEVNIASVQTLNSTAGPSIEELVRKVQKKLDDPDSALRVEQLAADVLGESLDDGFQRRFDDDVAEETLKFFRASNVPSIDPDLPRGVYAVRFTADLEMAPEILSPQTPLLSSAFR